MLFMWKSAWNLILLSENVLNPFIEESMVLVCHINHVIIEAFESFRKP
jgi:hypothetical protein